MEQKKLIAPSVLNADFGNLERFFEQLNATEADYIHLDIMDGVFVPNISFGFPVAKAIAKLTNKPLDVHLMIVHPERYVEQFCDLGAWSVGFHLEATEDPMPAINAIHAKGCRACLTINPDIDVKRLVPYLDKVEMVMLMSVFAGFGGQKFIPETLEKLRFLRREVEARGLNTLIEVDGGINTTNAQAAFEAGADILVAGTAVTSAADPAEAIRTLKGM